MADYINKDILCQAYIHIDPVPLDRSEYEAFKKNIQEYLNSRGKFFLYEDVETAIELKDGSLKIYATILGALYLAIGQYGSFRAGVDYLSSDVKRLSEVIVSESLFQSKSRHDNVKRIEARIGIIGSLKKIVNEIDHIRDLFGQAEPDNITKRIRSLYDKVAKMLSKLKDDNDIKYIKENLREEIEAIPNNPIPLPKKLLSESEKLFYREEREKLLQLCKMS